MCSIENLKVTINIICVLKAIVSVILIIIGAVLVGDYSYGLSYGSGVVGAGSTVIIIGIGSLISVPPLNFGIKRHNRAVILIIFFADCVILLVLLSIGTTLYIKTIPVFNKSLQLDCLRTSPLFVTELKCRDFYQSDRTAAFRLTWAAFYIDASVNRQQLSILQTSGACCGFYTPFRCLNDTRSFSSVPFPGKVPGDVLSQRVKCGHFGSFSPKRNYYVQQFDCSDYYDETTTPKILGGCKYDMGVGSCVSDKINAYSIGCASAMEDYMNSKMFAPALFLLSSCFINFVCILVCTIMYCKRKYEDVFPMYDQDLQYHNVEFRGIKDQFEVRPRSDMLVSRGFLTQAAMDKKHQPPALLPPRSPNKPPTKL